MRGHNNVQGASDHGSMPNNLPGYQSVDDPEVRSRFEKAWKAQLPSTKGFGQSPDGGGHSCRQAQSHVSDREDMSLSTPTPTTFPMHSPNSTSLSCRTFLQQYVPLCRRCAARSSEFGKGRHLHQHRAPHSAALSGVRTARGLSAGLEDHSGRCRPVGHGLALSASLEVMDEIASLTPLLPASTTTGWKGTNPYNGRSLPTEPMSPSSTRNALPSLTERPGCFLSHGLAPPISRS